MKLKGKVALITGSTRGIGKEFAIGFAKEGVDVIINGRNLEKAKAAAKEIESLGVRTMAIGADVSSSQEVNRMAEGGLSISLLLLDSLENRVSCLIVSARLE